MSEPTYHHGDLRAALLREAEVELTERGVERFSLRGVAKRAGVSHAAPAHHFGDTAGLLTALASIGFERFLETQKAREALAPDDERERLVASGLGYIEFAMANPALFRLMFGSDVIRREDAAFDVTSAAAFNHLAAGVSAATGLDPMRDTDGLTSMMSAWAIVHGLADLMLGERMEPLAKMGKDQREAMLRAIIHKAI